MSEGLFLYPNQGGDDESKNYPSIQPHIRMLDGPGMGPGVL